MSFLSLLLSMLYNMHSHNRTCKYLVCRCAQIFPSGISQQDKSEAILYLGCVLCLSVCNRLQKRLEFEDNIKLRNLFASNLDLTQLSY